MLSWEGSTAPTSLGNAFLQLHMFVETHFQQTRNTVMVLGTTNWIHVQSWKDFESGADMLRACSVCAFVYDQLHRIDLSNVCSQVRFAPFQIKIFQRVTCDGK